jgi:hypothetical protein
MTLFARPNDRSSAVDCTGKLPRHIPIAINSLAEPKMPVCETVRGIEDRRSMIADGKITERLQRASSVVDLPSSIFVFMIKSGEAKPAAEGERQELSPFAMSQKSGLRVRRLNPVPNG